MSTSAIEASCGTWEDELATLLHACLQLPCSRSSLSPPFRGALVQPERPLQLLSNVSAPLLLQAFRLCSPESTSSCGEGVPAHPLCKHLAHALCKWMSNSVFPRALECISGLSEEDHLEDKVKAWAEKIMGNLGTLQMLMQRVKLHLQVQEPLFTQLRETSSSDTLYVTMEKSCAIKAASKIKTIKSLVQGDLCLLNKVWLHEVQIGYSSCTLSNETKIFAALVYDEGGSNGVLLRRSLCEEEMVYTVSAMQMHCLPETKQPLKIVEDILEVLDVEGVKALLGFRATIGSIADALPPARSLLLASFLAAHGADVPGTKLTAGGRALAKHVHRGSSSWWGLFSGNDEKKNELALDSITYLIQHACWINVHYMPPNSFVFEVRVKEGYGARWTADGTKGGSPSIESFV